MSKRQQEFQGGGERYGSMDQAGDMSDAPKQATAAQMARRKIAQTRKPSGSQRSSRAGTPTGAVFGQANPQQSMPAFQPSGTGFGGDFNFSAGGGSNPFAQTNGASATPPPTNPFGGQSNQASQQNGGGSMFGNNNASAGFTFGAGNSQPQQNGFNPSSNMFGQDQTSKSTSSAFAGFGTNTQSQPQQNGLTPSTNNSFPSFGNQNNDNPFKGFGQPQQQTQSTPSTSFTGLGQNSQQNGDKAPSTSFVFGQTNTQSQPNGDKPLFGSTSQADQTPKTATSSIFSSFGQQNGDKPSLNPSAPSEQTPKPSTSSMFGGQQNVGKGLFGSTPPPSDSTTKPGESVFSSLNQAKNDGISANMFTQSRDSTPKPSTGNLFGAPAGSPAPEQTTNPTNIFGALNQPNGASATKSSNMFGEQQTPKPSSTPFSGTFGQQPSQQKPTPAFNFGQSQQDTSMTTPGNTPQKQLESNPQQSASESVANSSNQTPMGQGGSLFDRITPGGGAPATAQKPSFTPSTSFFNAPTNTDSHKTPAAHGGNLFDRANASATPATAIKPPSFAPSASALGQPKDKTSSGLPPSQPALAKTTAVGARDVTQELEKNRLKTLNEGFKAHLAKENPNADWTAIMRYYMQQAAKIGKKPEPKFDSPTITVSAAANSAPTTAPAKPAAPSNMFAHAAGSPPPFTPAQASTTNMFNTTTPQPTTSTNLFGGSQQTPKPTGAQGLVKAPQTAPISRKRPIEDDAEQPPATEKRTRANESTEYPKLPENASETAKLFQAAINRPDAVKPSSLAADGKEKQQQTLGQAAKDKAETEAKEKEKQTPNFGGFKPVTSTAGFTPSTAGFTPSAPTGMPTFSAPGATSGGFLAAFGKKAGEQEDKDRKKRKMEDYDSDEETEEAWAERDKKEQEAKKQKYLEAAKSGAGFTPSASVTPAGTPAPESLDGDASERESESETPMGRGKSLFDRVAPRDPPATAPSKSSLFSAPTPDVSKSTANPFASKTPSALGASPMSANLFGHLTQSTETDEEDKTVGEKDQGAGDNTWKPNTPIKFGGSTLASTESTTPAGAPNFGSLFGTSKTPGSTAAHLNIPKPAINFNFGPGQPSSLTPSRASTPGFTTDGEGASSVGEPEGEDEDSAPAEPQVEDQTGLRDSEKESEDCLFQVRMAKAMKWGEKKNDAGEIAWGWVEKGKGPLYILKHKESGKTRVVLKVPPYGTARMNFQPMKNVEYDVRGNSGKMVEGIFVDHMDKANATKPSKWLMQVGEARDAKEIARVLMEERA